MRVSNPSTYFGLVFLTGVFLALIAGSAVSQEADGPLRLILPEERAQDEVDEVPDPRPGTASQRDNVIENVVAPAESPTTVISSGGIEVGTLDAIGPDAIGVLLQDVEALPPHLWSGSRRASVDALLPRLPLDAPSAAMRRLMLRLLTSPAQPPVGPAKPGSFALLRAELLAAMGAREAAVTLLNRARPADSREVIARVESDRWLSVLDYDSACNQVSGMLDRSKSVYWRRVLILCQAQTNQLAAAKLGLDVLRESGADADPLFDDTIFAMADLVEPAVDVAAELTPLHIATLRLAQIPIPPEATVGAAPDLVAVIAAAPETLPLTRLLAAERAEATGAASVDFVRSVYRAMVFSPDERASALQVAETLDPPLGRSLLFQSVEAETVATARAEVLAAALSLAEEHNAYSTMARAVSDAVRSIPIRPEYSWFGETAGRALIASGDWAVAAEWFRLAAEQAPFDSEAEHAMQRLWPLISIASEVGPLPTSVLDRWLDHRRTTAASGDVIAQANLLVVLLEGLGHTIEPDVWDRLLSEQLTVETRAPVPALVRNLRIAAERSRLGETVLMSLLALGGGGPTTTDAATIGLVVSSLISVGLEQEARAIALEAALAAGL
jgi:hypothetical protein